jgi:D-alanyl-D-alanine carboxypeptidase
LLQKLPAIAIAVVLCLNASIGKGYAATPPSRLTDGERRSIDDIVRDTIERDRIPGLAIEIAVHGRPLYARTFGERSPGQSVTATTVFPIGSITKQFTAACVMMLAQAHRVNLDTPVSRYVRNAPHGNEITVRQLLDQTSGLLDYTEEPALQAALGASRLNRVSPVQLLAIVANKPLAFRPGSHVYYSNTNYVLAGMVVQAVSRETFQSFLERHILSQLAMHHASYLDTSVPQGLDVARGYGIKNGRVSLLPPFTMSWAGAAGALASDAGDLVKWDDAFFHGRVLEPASVVEMTRPVKRDYGYGWAIDRVDGQRMVWHNGGLPGAHAMNAYFPDSDMEVVVLTNIFTSDPEGIARRVYAVATKR